MIMASYVHGHEALEDVMPIRERVFVMEQGISKAYITDDYDHDAIHVVAFEGEQPVGAGRLVKIDDVYTIGKIAVLKDKRKKMYYGDLVVRMLIQKGFDLGAERIVVHAQKKQAVPFYEKVGFEAVGKKIYEKKQAIACLDMVIEKENIKKRNVSSDRMERYLLGGIFFIVQKKVLRLIFMKRLKCNLITVILLMEDYRKMNGICY